MASNDDKTIIRKILGSLQSLIAELDLETGEEGGVYLLRGMAFLLAGKPSGRMTLTVIDRILHTRLLKTHDISQVG
jgi:hypothetical protein